MVSILASRKSHIGLLIILNVLVSILAIYDNY